jgi:hypothetical protein
MAILLSIEECRTGQSSHVPRTRSDRYYSANPTPLSGSRYSPIRPTRMFLSLGLPSVLCFVCSFSPTWCSGPGLSCPEAQTALRGVDASARTNAIAQDCGNSVMTTAGNLMAGNLIPGSCNDAQSGQMIREHKEWRGRQVKN